MATEIGKDTKVKLSLETIISLGVVLVTAPPDPEVTRMEFDMKDQMIRNTIMNTQEDVKEIKVTLEKIEDKLYK